MHGEDLLYNYKIGDQIFFYYLVSEGNNENVVKIKKFEIYLMYKK